MALFEVTHEIFTVHFLFCHAHQMVLKALSKKAQHPMSTALPSSLSKIALTSWRRFPVVESGNSSLKRELEDVRTVTFSAESSHSRPHLVRQVPGASWGNSSCHQLPKLLNAASRWALRQESLHRNISILYGMRLTDIRLCFLAFRQRRTFVRNAVRTVRHAPDFTTARSARAG